MLSLFFLIAACRAKVPQQFFELLVIQCLRMLLHNAVCLNQTLVCFHPQYCAAVAVRKRFKPAAGRELNMPHYGLWVTIFVDVSC